MKRVEYVGWVNNTVQTSEAPLVADRSVRYLPTPITIFFSHFESDSWVKTVQIRSHIYSRAFGGIVNSIAIFGIGKLTAQWFVRVIMQFVSSRNGIVLRPIEETSQTNARRTPCVFPLSNHQFKWIYVESTVNNENELNVKLIIEWWSVLSLSIRYAHTSMSNARSHIILKIVRINIFHWNINWNPFGNIRHRRRHRRRLSIDSHSVLMLSFTNS